MSIPDFELREERACPTSQPKSWNHDRLQYSDDHGAIRGQFTLSHLLVMLLLWNDALRSSSYQIRNRSHRIVLDVLNSLCNMFLVVFVDIVRVG